MLLGNAGRHEVTLDNAGEFEASLCRASLQNAGPIVGIAKQHRATRSVTRQRGASTGCC